MRPTDRATRPADGGHVDRPYGSALRPPKVGQRGLRGEPGDPAGDGAAGLSAAPGRLRGPPERAT